MVAVSGDMLCGARDALWAVRPCVVLCGPAWCCVALCGAVLCLTMWYLRCHLGYTVVGMEPGVRHSVGQKGGDLGLQKEANENQNN